MKRLVLAGAGHAHLYTLRRTAELLRQGIEVVLVAPDRFWYSGLATGMLGGHYAPELDQVDVSSMVERGGGQWRQGAIVKIHSAENSVMLGSGEDLRYDVLSLNLGSEGRLVSGTRDRVIEIKPIANLARLRRDIEEAPRALRLVVVGAGASGCEIAANLRALQKRLGMGAQVVLLVGGPEVFPRGGRAARRKLRQILEECGVEIRLNVRVEEVVDQRLHLSDGTEETSDFAINATGLKPPGTLRESGLTIADDGALIVNHQLRSVSAGNVFGGGDCISLTGHALDKVGVYAIREAPVLFANLRASLLGGPLRSFRPQKRYLLILNLGDGTGLATWGGFHWHSRFAFRWKDFLDRRFLAKYQNGKSC